jgi:hypothetical protein
MGIDRKAEGTSTSVEREWCVCTSISVLEHVPRDVLAAWMAVESYADANGQCWPDNRTLAKRMSVGIKSAQRSLLKLEEYGIVKRHDQGGNRRSLTLLRRTSSPISAAEWASLQERGEARTMKRTNPLSMFDHVPL